MNILHRLKPSLLSQAKYECLSKKRMRFQDSLNPDVLLSVFSQAKSNCCCCGISLLQTLIEAHGNNAASYLPQGIRNAIHLLSLQSIFIFYYNIFCDRLQHYNCKFFIKMLYIVSNNFVYV